MKIVDVAQCLSLILYVLFLAAPPNGVSAILDSWRAEIRAEVAGEEIHKANKAVISRKWQPISREPRKYRNFQVNPYFKVNAEQL